MTPSPRHLAASLLACTLPGSANELGRVLARAVLAQPKPEVIQQCSDFFEGTCCPFNYDHITCTLDDHELGEEEEEVLFPPECPIRLAGGTVTLTIEDPGNG